MNVIFNTLKCNFTINHEEVYVCHNTLYIYMIIWGPVLKENTSLKSVLKFPGCKI